MTRAPIVPAAVLTGAGILLGLQRPVPMGGGPFAWAVAALGAAALLHALRPRPAGPALFLPLLFAAGLLLGTAARERSAATCAAVVPPDQPVGVQGVVQAVAGERLRLRWEVAEIAGVSVPCALTVPARYRGGGLAVGAAVQGRGRWWRPGGSQGVRVAGMLMLDSVAPIPPGSRRAAASPAALARARTAARLEALYGARAPLASSLLLAQRDGLDRGVRERFARAGLSHLLAISGLHVGLVAGLLLLIPGMLRLPPGPGSALAAGGTVAYVLFLGAPASAARAALQVVLLLLARALQRPARSEALVAAAALTLLALDPAALADAGFQLSFAGVAGLLWLRRPILRRLEPLARWRPRGIAAGAWLADGIASGVAATLATAPIVAWHFGRVAPIGVLANLPAIPLVGALVPALALSLAMDVLWPPAGAFIAAGGGVLLAALERVAAAAAAVPGGSVPVAPHSAAVWTAAALAGWVTTRRLGRVRPAVRAAAATAVAITALALAPLRPSGDHVELHVIDVGQGDAIAIRSPAGRWLLVDAGVGGAGFDAGERRVVPYLSLRGARRLEALVLTHPHADHFGGAGAVVRSLRPGWIGDPGVPAASPGYLDLLQSAGRARVPWVAVGDGLEVELDGVTVEFLHPFGPGPAPDDPNDISIVIRLEYGEFSALLTGDAPGAVEAALVRRRGAMLEAEVIKAGHHGSATSTTRELLQATGARVALISAGRGNRYGHPHAAVLERLEAAGADVLRTDRHGTIVVRGRASGEITIRRERESP